MKQERGNRVQGTERTAELLRRAIPPTGEQPELRRDLWPELQTRLRRKQMLRAVPWFDWALAGGVAVCVLAFPAAVPVLLYYL